MSVMNGVSNVDGVQPLEHMQAVAVGYINGARSIYNFGYNIVGTTELPIINGATSAYQYPVAATVMQVSSTSTTDTSTGTGARTLFITGLNSAYNVVDETVTLSGQNQVATVNSYVRINDSNIESAGSSETNNGTIFIGQGTATAGVVNEWYARLASGDGRSLSAVYTVPAQFRGVLVYLAMTSARTTATGFVTWRLMTRQPGGPFIASNKLDTEAAGGSAEITYAYSPLVFASGTDIELRALGSEAGNACSGHFSINLLPVLE